MKKILLLLCFAGVTLAANADYSEIAKWKFVEDSLTKSSSMGKFSNKVIDNVGGFAPSMYVLGAVEFSDWYSKCVDKLLDPWLDKNIFRGLVEAVCYFGPPFAAQVGCSLLTSYGRTWVQKVFSLNTFLTNWPQNKEKSPQAVWAYFDAQYELFLKNKFMYLVKNTSRVNRDFQNLFKI